MEITDLVHHKCTHLHGIPFWLFLIHNVTADKINIHFIWKNRMSHYTFLLIHFYTYI